MIDPRPIHLSPRGRVRGTVTVPASKSLTQRALALAALAEGLSRIESPLLADDTTRMVRALRSLGVAITAFGGDAPGIEEAILAGGSTEAFRDGGVEIRGGGGRLGAPPDRLDLGGAGTAMRFLTALSSLAGGVVVLDGDARMRQRPIGPLLEALGQLGVEATSLAANGCPPVRVRGGTLEGGSARLSGEISSQFVSALLMIAPLAPGRVEIEVLPPVMSRPYIDLTLASMRVFGAGTPPAAVVNSLRHEPEPRPLRFEFPGRGAYKAASFRVPPDASSASYFFAAAAATGGRVRVEGVAGGDPQGDAVLPDLLRAMGCRVVQDTRGTTVEGPDPGSLRAFDLDLAGTPDLVPTLAVLALFATGSSEIRNVPTLRVKESDRLHALATELSRLGARVEERADGLRIVPGPLAGARIETYRDHRIAMAFAVAGLVIPGITIADAGCVAKSFPGFWRTLETLRGGAP